MIVVGGVYGERCRFPTWDQLFGSGLRAAIALSQISAGTTLHTFVPNLWYDDITATLAGFGLGAALHRIEQPISFEYLHPFEQINELPEMSTRPPTIVATGEVILRFGMIEGDAKVAGRRVVYDPQSTIATFRENGSTAEELALIVTPRELFALSGRKDRAPQDDGYTVDDQALRDAAVELFDLWSSTGLIILVKNGLGGLNVFTGDDDFYKVPSYAAGNYFRIGSGDVMAAAFAHAWGERRLSVIDAADYAARSLAYFVEGPRLPIPAPEALVSRKPMRPRQGYVLILGAGAFEMEALVVHTCNWIEHLGGRAVYALWDLYAGISAGGAETVLVLIGSCCTESELHSIARTVARRSTVVFCPGSLEGPARDHFPDARITDDYATALYHALRSADK